MRFSAIPSAILVLVACCGLLLAPAGAAAQTYESWTEWYEATGGDGSPPGGGSGSGGPPGAVGGVTFYTDAGTFDGDFPGLPIEDFEESPVPPATVVGCEEPVDASSDDGCFSPGDILPNLALRTVEGIRTGCPAACPMAVVGGGVFGNPDHVVGPNFLVDTMRIEAFEDVCAMGMVLHNTTQDTFDITVTTAGDVIQTTADASAPGLFWGLDTGTDPILQIDLASQTGDSAELVDNIRFGVDTCAPGVPTTGGHGTAALAALLLGTGLLVLRRRTRTMHG